MRREMVDQVRRFNRVVTERVGALHDLYLGRDRSLGASRVLWEIGEHGIDIRSLRTQLNLDSGYISRVLHTLEDQGLIEIIPSSDDARVRSVSLTASGAAERAVLDQSSDSLAWSMLEPLTDAQRTRLVAAMGEVERLLTGALVEIDDIDPNDPLAKHCIREYLNELDERINGGFDPTQSLPAEPNEMRHPSGAFVIAKLKGRPLGCGGLKYHDDEPTELKRMWVAPAARGLGVGRRLLSELEARAVAAGSRKLRLETNGSLVEAIALYRSAGYREVPAFSVDKYAHHWFEKDLPTQAQQQS